MRKLISVILTAAMLMSLVIVGISAAPNAAEVGKVASGYKPEGTGIASLAEATDPAGKYYLTADIKVDATLPITFTGAPSTATATPLPCPLPCSSTSAVR